MTPGFRYSAWLPEQGAVRYYWVGCVADRATHRRFAMAGGCNSG